MAQYLEGTAPQQSRAYSPAVVTEGGRIVWMAGQTATVDGDGKVHSEPGASSRECAAPFLLSAPRAAGAPPAAVRR